MSDIRSIDLVEKYLVSRGYSTEHLSAGVSPSPLVRVTSRSGNVITLSRKALVYPFATTSLIGTFANKQISYGLMAENGVPVPHTVVIDGGAFLKGQIGQDVLKKYGTVVVKPLNGRRSIGLTIDISTESQLSDAVKNALEFCDEALVQEQFFGEEARFFVLDGKVRGVLLRQKPHVVGDGKTTIAELIQAENTLRANITDSMVNYPALDENNVPHDVLYSTRVPNQGETVELNRATMIKRGASVYDIFSTVHTSYIETIENIAKNFGKGMFVTDLMSKDFNLPAQPGNYIFLEFNLNASLLMCYGCRDGKHFKILEESLGPMIERSIELESVSD